MGFGFYIPEQNKLAHQTREDRILKLLRKPENQAQEIMYHHRFPTSTPNVENACHPFTTAGQTIFAHEYTLIHNGWINNAYDLRKYHESLGIQYKSVQPDGEFNDSESLLYDVALYLEGKQDTLQSNGAIAFILLKDGHELYFARNWGEPLKLKLDGNGIRLASEGPGLSIKPHTLHRFDEDNRQIIETELQMPESSYSLDDDYGWSDGYSTTFGYNTSATLDRLDSQLDRYSNEVQERAMDEINIFFGDFDGAAESIGYMIDRLKKLIEGDEVEGKDTSQDELRLDFYKRVLGCIYTMAWEYEEYADAYETFKAKGMMA